MNYPAVSVTTMKMILMLLIQHSYEFEIDPVVAQTRLLTGIEILFISE